MKAFHKLGCLFWERAPITKCCRCMEDIAMLMFYLPFMIFEAMFAKESKRKASEVDRD